MGKKDKYHSMPGSHVRVIFLTQTPNHDYVGVIDGDDGPDAITLNPTILAVYSPNGNVFVYDTSNNSMYNTPYRQEGLDDDEFVAVEVYEISKAILDTLNNSMPIEPGHKSR